MLDAFRFLMLVIAGVALMLFIALPLVLVAIRVRAKVVARLLAGRYVPQWIPGILRK